MKIFINIRGCRQEVSVENQKSEEQSFREAAKRINTKINQYRVAYGGANPDITTQDYMAMTAIQALAENFSLGERNDTKPYEDKINSLINELDNYRKK